MSSACFTEASCCVRSLEKESESDTDEAEKAGDSSSGYQAARESLKADSYDAIIKWETTCHH